MGDQLISSLTTIAVAIVSIAIIAVIVSRNADSSNIIKSAGSAFSKAIGAATAPVTGNSYMGGGVGDISLD